MSTRSRRSAWNRREWASGRIAALWRRPAGAALNPPVYLVSILPGLGVPLLAGGRSCACKRTVLATVAVCFCSMRSTCSTMQQTGALAPMSKPDSWVRVHHERPQLAVLHGAISLLTGGLLGLGVLWQQGR